MKQEKRCEERNCLVGRVHPSLELYEKGQTSYRPAAQGGVPRGPRLPSGRSEAALEDLPALALGRADDGGLCCSASFTWAVVSEMRGEHLFLSVLTRYLLSLLIYSSYTRVPEVNLAQGLGDAGATVAEGGRGVGGGRREL